MSEQSKQGPAIHAQDPEEIQSEAAFPGELPELPSWPLLRRASGLYQWRYPKLQKIPTPIPRPTPWPVPLSEREVGPGPGVASESGASIWWWFRREELRLDVDGRYPQNTASGTIYMGLTTRVHWIAELSKQDFNTWTGQIWYKNGDTAVLPHTNVRVDVAYSFFPNQRRAIVTFTGGGVADRIRSYDWVSSYFHPVEFEFDTVKGTSAITSIDTCDHPNRPASMPCENLTIKKVYQRAGFNVSISGGSGENPIGDAGADALWSDMEMHDAMQVYWSRFANKAQWAMWVLFAQLHEAMPPWIPQPEDLGGIMFDDIGPNHRQGTAIFNDSFIKDPPAGDPDPVAWVERTKFWCACHEIGHGFNLAHSWQKAMGTPWIPLLNEPEARSFMNYPYRVAGGQAAFFADFENRFTDQELLFMRHAPAKFVQMGNADWFDNHGFQQAEVSPEPNFRLEVRVHRKTNSFEFLEPVAVELKLTNVSPEPQIVDKWVLNETGHMTVIIKKDGKPARQWAPFATHLFRPTKSVLEPNKAIYAPLDISTGLNGWDVAEPGVYQVQLCLHLDEEDVVSNPLRLRIAPPRSYDEEYLAQDFLSEDVGRILFFNGSMFLEKGNKCLREVADRLKDRRVAYHARAALANPLTRDYKSLKLTDGTVPATSVFADKGSFKVMSAKPDQARKELAAALTANAKEAVETFGHIGYNERMSSYREFLLENGDTATAAKCKDELQSTLASHGVVKSMLEEIERTLQVYDELSKGKGAAAKAKPKKKVTT